MSLTKFLPVCYVKTCTKNLKKKTLKPIVKIQMSVKLWKETSVTPAAIAVIVNFCRIATPPRRSHLRLIDNVT